MGFQVALIDSTLQVMVFRDIVTSFFLLIWLDHLLAIFSTIFIFMGFQVALIDFTLQVMVLAWFDHTRTSYSWTYCYLKSFVTVDFYAYFDLLLIEIFSFVKFLALFFFFFFVNLVIMDLKSFTIFYYAFHLCSCFPGFLF